LAAADVRLGLGAESPSARGGRTVSSGRASAASSAGGAGFGVPGQDDTDLLTTLEALPEVLLGYGFFYWLGMRQEDADEELLAT
jgi:hypothetical protein